MTMSGSYPPLKTDALVLGTGFGGTAFISALQRKVSRRHGRDLAVMAVNSHNSSVFSPLLYQVATGLVDEHHLAAPACCFLRGHGFNFLNASVREIHPTTHSVLTSRGEISYKYLVISLGTTTNDYGIPGAAHFAVPLKELRDGERIRNRVIASFERALALDPRTDEVEASLTFVVVGAGATGVELAGALTEYLKLLKRRHRNPEVEPRVLLLEARNRIMESASERFSRRLQQLLEDSGIEVLLAANVASVSETGILLADGREIRTKNVFWTAGVKSSIVVESLGRETGQMMRGRLLVDANLRLLGFPDVYVVGDCVLAHSGSDGAIVPQTAAAAVQEGRYAGRHLAGLLETGRSIAPFRYADNGTLLSLGRFKGLYQVGGRLMVSGVLAWLMWRFIHLTRLATVTNRVGVVSDWFFSFFHRRIVVQTD